MAQLECVIEGQARTNGNLGEFATDSAGYAGKSGNYYYTHAVKFTVPEFVGVPKEITFGLCLSSVYDRGHVLQAAIVSSLDNFPRYVNATAPVGPVEDENQVAAGQTPTFENITSLSHTSAL